MHAWQTIQLECTFHGTARNQSNCIQRSTMPEIVVLWNSIKPPQKMSFLHPYHEVILLFWLFWPVSTALFTPVINPNTICNCCQGKTHWNTLNLTNVFKQLMTEGEHPTTEGAQIPTITLQITTTTTPMALTQHMKLTLTYNWNTHQSQPSTEPTIPTTQPAY